MRQSPLFHKILPLVVIASMLSLASLTADSVFTSYGNAIPEVSQMVNDGETTEDYLLRVAPELSFNVDLVPAGKLRFPGDRPQASAKPALAVLSLKDIISEIFIPPKTVS